MPNMQVRSWDQDKSIKKTMGLRKMNRKEIEENHEAQYKKNL